MKDDVAIIIPAYNPNEKLKEIVEDLKRNKYTNIIVINDGSQNKEIFKKIEYQTIVLEQKQNYGKGRALKKGIKYVLQHIKGIKGILTIDADGQHKIEDINKVYQAFQQNENSLVLGTRNFNEKTVPFRSKLGNKIISYILLKKYNKKLNDTQTGLRAIPKRYFKEMIQISGDRFDYEMYMILHCIKNDISMIEVPIESIYINKNKSSNYKIIKDSLKISKAVNCKKNR